MLCSELDYLGIRNPEYQFVCSFYPLYFFAFIRIEHEVDNWLDIKNYHLNVEILREKGKELKWNNLNLLKYFFILTVLLKL